ncbi:hypothetical protein B0H11DRAFT_1931431 [Mycena galericulata]|nr:hypothetical protein B0H11DRAFT_1931431 [Mycena galericulata]
MSDQCALDSGGQLKDASEIDFYDSESDEKALPREPPDDAPRRRISASPPGLTTHLKNDFPVMYRLYCALHIRRDEPPTQQEIDLARGDVSIDSDAAKAYLGKVETATANIIKSLENQAKKARVCVQSTLHCLPF